MSNPYGVWTTVVPVHNIRCEAVRSRRRSRFPRRPAAGMEAYGAKDLVAALASYVPNVIVRRLACDPRPLREPLAEQLAGAVLVADVSGFTPLAESLARYGPRGAEMLTGILNDYFGRAMDVITAHGGDVVRFAGDAVLAAWYDPGQDAAELTRRAAAAPWRCKRGCTAIKPLKACRFDEDRRRHGRLRRLARRRRS